MPGLPTKETKKRFSKLMKSSRKSKTNSDYGGKKINNLHTKESRILNFEKFNEKYLSK